MMERMATLGYGIVGNSPEEFGKQIALEIEKWGRLCEPYRRLRYSNKHHVSVGGRHDTDRWLLGLLGW